MGTLEEGVRQAIENCLKVQEADDVVVTTDRETLEIGLAMRTAAERIAGRPGRLFVMEEFGTRPILFPQVVRNALLAADVSIFAAQGVKGELASFRQPMVRTVEASRRLRHAHMIGITPQIMRDGMCSDYREIQRISRLVNDRVRNARAIRVVTGRGSDFTAEFAHELRWEVSDGDITPGHWKNLPDGEVFTCPANLNGQIVIDGCLGDFFDEKYASLEDTPVRVKVEDGKALRESLQCDNPELRREFETYVFETDENSHRLGEFAIGTNTGLTRLIHNLLQDEKFPGIHIAFGSPSPAHTGATWDSTAHLDGVLKSPTVDVDGELIMTEGRFQLE